MNIGEFDNLLQISYDLNFLQDIPTKRILGFGGYLIFDSIVFEYRKAIEFL